MPKKNKEDSTIRFFILEYNLLLKPATIKEKTLKKLNSPL